MTNAEKAGLTITKPETTFEEMLNAIWESLRHLASCDDAVDGEDEHDDQDDTELGQLSEHDETRWVMGTITKMVQHQVECFGQTQMTLDKITQLGWGDMADCYRGWDKKYGITELNVPAVIQPQTDADAALVLATVPDRHFGSGSGSKPNRCQIGGPGRQ